MEIFPGRRAWYCVERVKKANINFYVGTFDGISTMRGNWFVRAAPVKRCQVFDESSISIWLITLNPSRSHTRSYRAGKKKCQRDKLFCVGEKDSGVRYMNYYFFFLLNPRLYIHSHDLTKVYNTNARSFVPERRSKLTNGYLRFYCVFFSELENGFFIIPLDAASPCGSI